MTPELLAQIEATEEKTVLEDLYLPYKPKKRTRATIAIENGLERLAEVICAQEETSNTAEEIGRAFLNEEKGIGIPALPIQGGFDILAERIAERRSIAKPVREHGGKKRALSSLRRAGVRAEERRRWKILAMRSALNSRTTRLSRKGGADHSGHRILAIRRGEKGESAPFFDEMNDEQMGDVGLSRCFNRDVWSEWWCVAAKMPMSCFLILQSIPKCG